MEILSFIPITLIAFFPILLWGYIFSYLDNSPLGGKRFAMGIIAGGISVVPVLFLSEIMSMTGLTSLRIFPLLAGDGSFALTISLSLAIILISLTIFAFSIGIFFEHMAEVWRTFLKNLGVVLLLGVLFSLFHAILGPLSLLGSPLSGGGVTIGGTVFGTMKLVLFYYLVIAIIEEASKHFSMLTSSLPAIRTVKQGVLFSVFIALWFGFIENILYLKNLSEQSGLWSSGVLTTWIFRSVFSLLTHIICSISVGLYFSRAFLAMPKLLPYVKALLTGFILSVTLHAIFDISLTIGFTGIIFIYFFWGYMGITRIFYSEEAG